jgi:hypothetical protein
MAKPKAINYKKDNWLCVLALIYSFILLFVLIDNACQFNPYFAGYFTNLTNIFCCIWLFLFGISGFIKNQTYHNIIRNKTLVAMLNMSITITFLVVALWLSPIWNGKWVSGGINGTLLYTHLLTAIVMWLVTFYYRATGKFNWKTNFLVLIFPLTYFAIMLIIPLLIIPLINGRTWYPYNFINPSFYHYNYYIFAAVIVALGSIFYGVSYLLYFIKVSLNKKSTI